MKRFITTLVGTLALGIASSHATLYALSGTMDPFQATNNPGNVGVGTGTISGSYDDVTNQITYSVAFSGLTAPVTVSHFHFGAPGVGGPVRLGIPSAPVTSGIFSGGPVVITEAHEGELLAGNWYVNIHTQNFTGGEIRGQVGVTAIPEPGTSVLALGGLGLLLLRRRRA